MKIGDLVQVKLGTGVYEHRKFFGKVGILLCIGAPKKWTAGVVYLMGKRHLLRLKDLEVVNESR